MIFKKKEFILLIFLIFLQSCSGGRIGNFLESSFNDLEKTSQNEDLQNNLVNKKNSDFGYYSKNSNRSEKNERFLNNSAKNKNVDNFKKNNTFSSLKRRNPRFKSNTEFPNKNSDMHQEFTNKRNFDDWIWGKHSVYEALISERAINRIWCTSEIFSSEKFYILL